MPCYSFMITSVTENFCNLIRYKMSKIKNYDDLIKFCLNMCYMLTARNEGPWWFCSTKLSFFFFLHIDLISCHWFPMDYFFFISISSWLLWLRKGCRLFNSIVIHVCCYPQRWQSLNLQFTCHSFLCLEAAASLKKTIIYCYRSINFSSSYF